MSLNEQLIHDLITDFQILIIFYYFRCRARGCCPLLAFPQSPIWYPATAALNKIPTGCRKGDCPSLQVLHRKRSPLWDKAGVVVEEPRTGGCYRESAALKVEGDWGGVGWLEGVIMIKTWHLCSKHASEFTCCAHPYEYLSWLSRGPLLPLIAIHYSPLSALILHSPVHHPLPELNTAIVLLFQSVAQSHL